MTDSPEKQEPQETHDARSGNLIAETVRVAGKSWALHLPVLEALAERMNGRTFVGDSESMAARSSTKPPKVQGNGVAVVPVSGMIAPKLTFMAWLMGADAGLDEIMGMIKAGIADPDVRAVVLDMDSPGGLVDGVPEAAAELAKLRSTGGKPIVAVANVMIGSAAYWLASQAHEIVASPSSEVGSVGVYQLHRDMSEAAKNAGVKFTYISAGEAKTDGNPHEPLSDAARADAQQAVDDYYGMFVNSVASGRHDGIGEPETPSLEGDAFGGGRTFTAKRAVKAGLADRVGTLQETISRLSSGRAKIRRHADDLGDETVADEPKGPPTSIAPGDKSRLLTVLTGLGVKPTTKEVPSA